MMPGEDDKSRKRVLNYQRVIDILKRCYVYYLHGPIKNM